MRRARALYASKAFKPSIDEGEAPRLGGKGGLFFSFSFSFSLVARRKHSVFSASTGGVWGGVRVWVGGGVRGGVDAFSAFELSAQFVSCCGSTTGFARAVRTGCAGACREAFPDAVARRTSPQAAAAFWYSISARSTTSPSPWSSTYPMATSSLRIFLYLLMLMRMMRAAVVLSLGTRLPVSQRKAQMRT